MTAVVGILNKKAIAIAADSAVTLHNGKIFNKANKIFTLSKHFPVGVMIHGQADFMGMPWETIIKEYRKQLGEGKFDCLQMYQDDFIAFLHRENFFCSDVHQANALNIFCNGITGFLINEVNKIVKADDPSRVSKFLDNLKAQTITYIDRFSSISEKLPEFVDFTFEKFDNYVEPKIQEVIDYSFVNNGIPIDADTRTLLKKAYYSELIVKEFYTTAYTGVVFAGFGEREMFPSLTALQVYFGFNGKLRYFVNSSKGAVISHSTHSGICTFAQSDVMFTILTGIAPELKETYSLTFKQFLGDLYQALINNHHNDKGDLLFSLERLNKDLFVQAFNSTMDQIIQRKYISPLFESIAGLSKEDLAEMAESLIYLTYLQRRITNAEESVGGPVDVAVISKGDGFIWLKRKHYFDPEINSHFFKKYFD